MKILIYFLIVILMTSLSLKSEANDSYSIDKLTEATWKSIISGDIKINHTEPTLLALVSNDNVATRRDSCAEGTLITTKIDNLIMCFLKPADDDQTY